MLYAERQAILIQGMGGRGHERVGLAAGMRPNPPTFEFYEKFPPGASAGGSQPDVLIEQEAGTGPIGPHRTCHEDQTMKTQLIPSRWRHALRSFHEDEEGMESLQVVMIVAIGAVVLLVLKLMWPSIKGWVMSAVGKITRWRS